MDAGPDYGITVTLVKHSRQGHVISAIATFQPLPLHKTVDPILQVTDRKVGFVCHPVALQFRLQHGEQIGQAKPPFPNARHVNVYKVHSDDIW